MGLAKYIDLPFFGENDGCLVPIEQLSEVVPFELKRVYYIFDVKDGLRRGFHAHKTLHQLLICVSGQCDVELDDGSQREKFLLDSPTKGLLIQQPLWREMANFSKGAVLIVLASEKYDTEDYIWDYDEFKAFNGV